MQQLALSLPGVDPEGESTTITLEGPTEMQDKFTDVGSVITALIPILFSIAGLILFLMLVWGGYQLLFSAGDPGMVEAGRTRITNAVIGFVIIFVAASLVQLLSFIFGFPGFF